MSVSMGQLSARTWRTTWKYKVKGQSINLGISGLGIILTNQDDGILITQLW